MEYTYLFYLPSFYFAPTHTHTHSRELITKRCYPEGHRVHFGVFPRGSKCACPLASWLRSPRVVYGASIAFKVFLLVYCVIAAERGARNAWGH